MNFKWQILALTLALAGCTSNHSRSSYSPGEIHVLEFVVAEPEGRPLEGVDAFLEGSEEQYLGKTDAFGRISIETALLRAGQAHAVLFCRERYFCGAMRITRELNGYAEKYIVLARFAVL